jgi:hypothetical protein
MSISTAIICTKIRLLFILLRIQQNIRIRAFIRWSYIYAIFLCSVSILICFGQNKRAFNYSGEILIYLNSGFDYYYAAREGGAFEEVRFNEGKKDVFSDPRFKNISEEKLKDDSLLIQNAKSKYFQSAKNKYSIPWGINKFNVNPTAEYIIEKNDNPIKKVYNLISGDSLEIQTSPRNKELFLNVCAWSPDGKWLAISAEDSIVDRHGQYNMITVNLSQNKRRVTKFDEHIEKIVWDNESRKVGVLTQKAVNAYNPFNIILIPFGRSIKVWDYYFYIINIDDGNVIKMPIADRINTINVVGVFWVK